MSLPNLVHISVGSTGASVGERFWELVAKEHSIDAKYQEEITGQPHMLFRENSRGARFTPRAIIGTPSEFPQKEMFDPINVIKLKKANNFSETRFEESALFEEFMVEVERCDNLKYVTMSHASSEPHGSGTACKLIEQINTEFPKTSPHVFTSMASENPVYDTVFSLQDMMSFAKSCTIFGTKFDNSMEKVISQFSCSSRFQSNGDLEKVIFSLIPFKDLKLCTPTYVARNATVRAISELNVGLRNANDMWNRKNRKSVDFASLTLIYRGEFIRSGEVFRKDTIMSRRLKGNESCLHKFVTWDLNVGETNVVAMSNSTKILDSLGKMKDIFEQQLAKKMFLHYYPSLDIKDFEEAYESACSVIDSYRELASEKGEQE